MHYKGTKSTETNQGNSPIGLILSWSKQKQCHSPHINSPTPKHRVMV